MIFETIATSVVKLLGSSLLDSKGANTAKDEATNAIWQWIRPIFLKDEEKKEQLQQFEAEPTKPEHQKAVVKTTQLYLEQNPNQITELDTLMERVKAAHPEKMGDIINMGNVEKQVNNPIIKGGFNM